MHKRNGWIQSLIKIMKLKEGEFLIKAEADWLAF
jgi:hypothetical protein